MPLSSADLTTVTLVTLSGFPKRCSDSFILCEMFRGQSSGRTTVLHTDRTNLLLILNVFQYMFEVNLQTENS